MNSCLLTILIPFHHEEASIGAVIQGLADHTGGIKHETLLIHDDPKDPTLDIITSLQKDCPHMRAMLNTHAPGVPGAIRTGFENARGEYIMLMVADDPSPCALIIPMIKLLNEGYDLIAPSRYIKSGKAQGGESLSRALSYLGNHCFRLMGASRLSDITCGIKMFRKDILNRISLKSDTDWTIAFELAVQAQYLDLKVTEIPYISYNRLSGGKSHFKLIPRLLNYSRVFIWGVLILWKKRLHV